MPPLVGAVALFVKQPQGGFAGQLLSQQPVVHLVSVTDGTVSTNPIAGQTATCTLSLRYGAMTTVGSLIGGTLATVDSGVFQFTSVAVDAGGYFYLQASCNAAAPSTLGWSVQSHQFFVASLGGGGLGAANRSAAGAGNVGAVSFPARTDTPQAEDTRIVVVGPVLCIGTVIAVVAGVVLWQRQRRRGNHREHHLEVPVLEGTSTRQLFLFAVPLDTIETTFASKL